MGGAEEWTLQRAYAFEVQADDETAPERGALKITKDLRRILDKVVKKTEVKRRTLVTLVLDTATRTSAVRDDVMAFAFAGSAGSEARVAAERLARKLCESMDGRSHEGLFMLACRTRGEEADVQMMLFPREDTVRLKKGADPSSESVVTLLQNAFSAGKHVRKVTSFRGKHIKTKFLNAEVIDWQTGSGRDAADYWIDTFLEGRLALNAQKGSELLARGLKLAAEGAEDDDDRDVVFAETVIASNRKGQLCSLAEFSERLPVAARDAFLSVAEPEVSTLTFKIDPNVVRRLAGRRSFEGVDGVRVSAPQAAIGKSVKFDVRNDGRRIVKYEGTVTREKVERE